MSLLSKCKGRPPPRCCCCPFLLGRNNGRRKRDYEEDSGGFGEESRRKRLRQWPPLPRVVLISGVGVERERLIGGKGGSADVWCNGEHRNKYLCVGCWEEDVLRGCSNRPEAGELAYA